MSRQQFQSILHQEIERIDQLGTTKRYERIIEGFSDHPAPQALIKGERYRIFNSNDYLGLRFHPQLKAAEHEASQKFGSGPGAVRFISGTTSVHHELEQAIAKFHGRDDAMIFSSAFATNLAVLFCLLKGQSKDALVSDRVLVVSDELNHRSIIDGIRIANLASEQKSIFKHMDPVSLRQVLIENRDKWQRVLVVTDGVFSMLGEYQDLAALRVVIEEFDADYPEGVWLVVDDAHGVAAFGKTGRGTEEMSGASADILIGTFGKALGADGGYVVADQVVIDYLRESAATYIYSNSISPGTAGAALAAIQLVDTEEGQRLRNVLTQNISWFIKNMTEAGFSFVTKSSHPIQPWFIGDTQKTKTLKQDLFEKHFIVTNINYPVVPKGKDEIRVQLSAAHTEEDLEAFVTSVKEISSK